MNRSASLARGTARFDTLQGGALGIALCLCFASEVRAEQFVVTDVTYTHSGETTMDSHYHVNPAPGSPGNWTSPVNYAGGSVHVLLEVKTKPTKTPTKFQICFEGTPSYACTNQSEPYTEVDTYKWETPFAKFYYGGDVDWTKGIKKIALILKNTSNGKPQGDPNYVPTDLRVVVTLLSPGAMYEPPAAPRDAGVASDAGSRPSDAGSRPSDAGSAPPDAGRAGSDAGTGAPIDASAPAQQPDASSIPPITADAGALPAKPDASTTPSRDAGRAPDAGTSGDAEDDSASEDSDSGCSVSTHASPDGALILLALAGLLAAGRRRRDRIR